MSYYLADLGARRKRRVKPVKIRAKGRGSVGEQDIDEDAPCLIAATGKLPTGYHEETWNRRGDKLFVKNGYHIETGWEGGGPACVKDAPRGPSWFPSDVPQAAPAGFVTESKPPSQEYTPPPPKKVTCEPGYVIKTVSNRGVKSGICVPEIKTGDKKPAPETQSDEQLVLEFFSKLIPLVNNFDPNNTEFKNYMDFGKAVLDLFIQYGPTLGKVKKARPRPTKAGKAEAEREKAVGEKIKTVLTAVYNGGLTTQSQTIKYALVVDEDGTKQYIFDLYILLKDFVIPAFQAEALAETKKEAEKLKEKVKGYIVDPAIGLKSLWGGAKGRRRLSGLGAAPVSLPVILIGGLLLYHLTKRK